MADREVEVSVNAEGVDEAAGEMGGEAAAAGGVGGPDGGGGGGRIGGKLIGRLLGLVAFLGPILDVIGIVADILEAFVAPVAVLLLRLLQPVLRLMLRILPVWFAYTDLLMDVIDGVVNIRNDLMTAIFTSEKRLRDVIYNLPGRIWGAFSSLAADIASAIVQNVPGVSGTVERTEGARGLVREGLESGVDTLTGERQLGEGPLVEIDGGLQPFIDRITQDGSFDFP